MKRQMLGWLCLLTLLFLLPACRADGQESPGTDLSAGSQVPTETGEQPPPAPVDRSTKIGVVGRIASGNFRYQGWPSVCVDENGVLYAVSSSYRLGHICPFGKNVMYTSENGEDWSSPYIINDSIMDDRDVGILSLGDGKLLMSYFYNPPSYYYDYFTTNTATTEILERLEEWRHLPEEQQIRGGSYVRLSRDNGTTWEEPVWVPVTSPHGPVLLSDGRLLYVGNEWYTDGIAEEDYDTNAMLAFVSEDEGQTWEYLSRVNYRATGLYLCEPYAVELPDGTILLALRGQGASAAYEFTVYLSRSTNGGKTWTMPEETGFCGSPPHLLVHSSGAVVLTYGRREAPCGVRARISYDNGKTWSEEVILNDRSPDSDCGYPCSAELPDGSIVTVYYQKYQEGESTSILYTKWWLPEA